MRAYSQTISKSDFVRELKAHQKADDFVKGRYWAGGKGCAVGCSLESISRLKGLKFSFEDHSLYPIHLGIPEWLARLEDTLFEGVTTERSKSWPVEFAEAIQEGADLEVAETPFLLMVLEHSLASVNACKYAEADTPDAKVAIDEAHAAVTEMIRCHREGLPLEPARAAAWAAAELAAWLAWGARSAALSAAWSADRSARSAADSAYNYYADRLLEILRECK